MSAGAAEVRRFAAATAAAIRANPDCWTQHAYARREDGNLAGVLDKDATSWCLIGHWAKWNGFEQVPTRAETPAELTGSAMSWQDMPGRRPSEVIAYLERIAAGDFRPPT